MLASIFEEGECRRFVSTIEYEWGYWVRWYTMCPQNTGGGNASDSSGPSTEHKQQLINALKNLGEGCTQFFGGRDVINQRIDELSSNNLQIEPFTSSQAIPGAIANNTVSAYWDDWVRRKGPTTATVVYFNIWNGWTDMQVYSTIILGPAFYDPVANSNSGMLALYGGKVSAYQSGVLVHEYMHWLNNATDLILALKWDLYGKGYDIGDPSIAIDTFISNDCK
jgi:hypothetical protein